MDTTERQWLYGNFVRNRQFTRFTSPPLTVGPGSTERVAQNS